MKVFKDGAGREWTVAINFGAVRRCHDLADCDLMNLADGNQFEKSTIFRLDADAMFLSDVLWAVIKPQADAAGVTKEQFEDGMAGDLVETAKEALLAEIVNFTPNRRDRVRLQTAWKKIQNWTDRGRDALEKRLEDPKLEAMVSEAIETLGDSSSSLPPLPAATPSPEP